MTIRVTFWGTRGSMTTPGKAHCRYGGNTACVELAFYEGDQPGAEIDTKHPRLLLDAGTGLLDQCSVELKRAGALGNVPKHILLSHYHWDHLIGIPFYSPCFMPDSQINFYGGCVTQLEQSLGRLFSSPYSPIEKVKNVAAEFTYQSLLDREVRIGEACIRCEKVNHSGHAISIRVEYNGTVIVYTPDHEAGDKSIDQALAALAHKADLWILNAFFKQADYSAHKGWGHSGHENSMQLALQAQAKRVALFHHNPDYDDETLDQLNADAVALGKGKPVEVLMARDGLVLVL